MSYISIDHIARSWLLDKGYPIHWYIDAVNECSNFLKEASLHSLQIVTPHILTLNSYKAAPIPCGVITWTVVGIPNGQLIAPIAQREGFNRLTKIVDGVKAPYGATQITDDTAIYDSYYWLMNTNRYGEDLGQRYGGHGQDHGAFKIISERNEVQFDEGYSEGLQVYSEWVGSMNNVTAASRIPEECFTAAKAYIDWKVKLNNRSSDRGQVKEAEFAYNAKLRILRAQRFDYGLEDIVNIFYASINAAPK
jgi:hypothetical protein